MKKDFLYILPCNLGPFWKVLWCFQVEVSRLVYSLLRLLKAWPSNESKACLERNTIHNIRHCNGFRIFTTQTSIATQLCPRKLRLIGLNSEGIAVTNIINYIFGRWKPCWIFHWFLFNCLLPTGGKCIVGGWKNMKHVTQKQRRYPFNIFHCQKEL